MNMKFLLAFLCCLFLCLNAYAGNKNFSGFMLFGSPNTNNLSPISQKYKGETPEVNLDNGNDLTIIIYSHGTVRPQKKENCTKSYHKIPRSLKILKEFENTYFYYLCSKATDGGVLGSYIDKRKREINKVLDQLLSPWVTYRITDTTLYGNDYEIYNLFEDLTNSIFDEDLNLEVSYMRKNLQTTYVRRLIKILAEDYYDEITTAAAYGSLRKIEKLMKKNSRDAGTKVHRSLILWIIDSGLNRAN